MVKDTANDSDQAEFEAPPSENSGLAKESVQALHRVSSRSKPKKNWRSFFRFQLWMLLLMFIPAAFVANRYGADLSVKYTEEKDLFWKDGMTDIDFETLPNGKPTARSLPVDAAYQQIGVTFAIGTPFRDPATETAVGETSAIHILNNGEMPTEKQAANANVGVANTPVMPGIPKGSRLNSGYLVPPVGDYLTSLPKSNPKLAPTAKAKKAPTGYIGISGYPFSFPACSNRKTICCFEMVGTFAQRFKGSMTIRFHKPGEPKRSAGPYRIGFFAARLNDPETLEVRLYGMDGELLCRQANVADRPCAFMGFTSNKRISRIEIETIGKDKDYAISGVMYDAIK